jgi:hypothetical protein
MNETCYSVNVTMWSLTLAHGLQSYICTWQHCATRTILPSLNQTHLNAALTKVMKTVVQSVRQVATIRIQQYLPFSVPPSPKTTINISLHKFGRVILQRTYSASWVYEVCYCSHLSRNMSGGKSFTAMLKLL